MSDTLETVNPINGKATRAESLRELKPAHQLRQDWASGEIVDLLTLPLLELVDQARGGAGIVADSEPRAERLETEAKIAAILSALTDAARPCGPPDAGHIGGLLQEDRP